MPFEQFRLDKSVNQSRGIFDKYIYVSDVDTITQIRAVNYFAQSRFFTDDPESWIGALIEVRGTDGYAVLQVAADGISVEEVGAAGGAGALIVATRSDNSNPAVFADFAALDTYTGTTEGTADAARINVTDSIRAREVFAVGTLDGNNQVTGITAAYIRLNGAWVSVATNLVGTPGAQGPAGPAGAGIDLTGVADGTILQSVSEVAVASSLVESSTEVVSDKSIVAPDATVRLGGLSISNAGFNLMALLPDGRRFFPVAYQLTTSGSATPTYLDFGAESTEASAANISETFTGSSHQFNMMNSSTGLIFDYTVNSAATGDITDCNLTIRLGSHADQRIAVFDYKRATGGTGFTISSGESTIEFPPITLPGVGDAKLGAFVEESIELFITIEAGQGQTLELRGQTLSGVEQPYLEIGRQNADRVNILSENSEEFLEDTTAALLTNGQHQGITVTYQDTATPPRIDLDVTGVTPPVSPSAAITNFSIDIPAVIQVNTSLNSPKTIQFTTQGTSDITALTLIVTTGDAKTLTVPTTDGTHTENLTLSGIDTSSAGTVTFQIRGTTTGGQTIMSNTQTVTVRINQPHEYGYYGVRPTDDFATVDVSNLTQVDVSQPGTVFDVDSLSFPSQEYFGILVPEDRELTRLTNPNAPDPSSDIRGDFTTTTQVRQINSVDYTLYLEQNLSSFTGTLTLRATTE